MENIEFGKQVIHPERLSYKLNAFEYCLHKLEEWRNGEGAEINRLKALNLLFFVTAVETSFDDDFSKLYFIKPKKEKLPETTNFLLDHVFDCMYAVPFGTFENDVAFGMKKHHFRTLIFQDSKLRIFGRKEDISLAPTTKQYIDAAIDKLKEMNPYLVRRKPFHLVDTVLQFYSWKRAFSKARKNNKLFGLVEHDDIKKEVKCFGSLNFDY